MSKWKKSKNIVDVPNKKNKDLDSPRDTAAFSPWVENEASEKY